VASEIDEVETNTVKQLEQFQHSYDEASSRGERVPALPDLFADWDAVQARLAQSTHLAELGLDDDAPRDRTFPSGTLDALPSHSIRCQPTLEMRGRLADWVADIRRVRDLGETTLFVAATAGRAERTIELLKEYDVFAVPVERAEGARYATVLVATGDLSRGFRLRDAGLQIYAEADVFEEERRAPDRRHLLGAGE